MKTIEYIENVVCAGEKIEPIELHTPSQKRDICNYRQLVMTLAQEFGNTQEEAGKYFNRDHATAYSSKNAISNLYDTDKTWQIKIDLYRRLIRSDKIYDMFQRKESKIVILMTNKEFECDVI